MYYLFEKQQYDVCVKEGKSERCGRERESERERHDENMVSH